MILHNLELEKENLLNKINKLDKKILNPEGCGISEVQLSLMINQLDAMCAYEHILHKRIVDLQK